MFIDGKLFLPPLKRSLRRLCFHTCLSVILFAGAGVSFQRGEGDCIQSGVYIGGQWGLHPGGRGAASRGSLHPGGLHPGGMGSASRGSASRGSASRGFASRGLHLGGLHPGRSAFRGVGRTPPPIRYYGIRSTSGCTDPTEMHSCIEVKLISLTGGSGGTVSLQRTILSRFHGVVRKSSKI